RISLESARATKDGTSLDLSGGNLATGSVRLSAAGSEGKSSWQVSLASLAGSGQRPNSAYRTRNAALRWDQDLDSNRTLTVTGYLIDGYTRLPGSIYAPTAGDWQSGIWHNWSLTYASGKPDGNRQLFRCYTVSQSLSGLTGTPFADSNRLLGGQYRDAASLDADNLLSWGAEWLAESASGTGVGNNSFRRTNLDLFADNRQQLTDQVQLTYGARGSFSSQYGGYFLPQFTYLNNYSGHSSFFANLSRVFSPPTFLDLYGTDSYGNHGNPALRPEQGWTAETGWKTDHDGYFATYALFYRRIHDAIRWLPVDPDSPLSSWQPQNVDTLTAWGASLTARCQLSAVTAASAAYTWLQSFDQNGRTVGDPGNVASLSLTFREDRWQNTVTAAYTGPSGIAAQTVGGYLVVNTATSYRFDDRTTIYLVASNLLGRSYCPVFGYPADRLTARLGLDVRF
ncbi:MAG: TonB-dependent receptor, partial [Negativicutes bacterium]|nr:TonB-dependent receptor [Negativicutes bacterium]